MWMPTKVLSYKMRHSHLITMMFVDNLEKILGVNTTSMMRIILVELIRGFLMTSS